MSFTDLRLGALVQPLVSIGLLTAAYFLPTAALPPIDLTAAKESTGRAWCYATRGSGALYVDATRYETGFDAIFGFGPGPCDPEIRGRRLTAVWWEIPDGTGRRLLLEIYDPSSREVIGASREDFLNNLRASAANDHTRKIVQVCLVLIAFYIVWPNLRPIVRRSNGN